MADPVEVGPFSERLNVLHAPNATGKSTLFEALLRGLLDSHGVGGREVAALRPWGRALAPTVTVEFAHGGVEYRLTKRFLDRPLSELERQEGGRFVRMAEGDAADEKVREILTRNPPGKGLARPANWGLAQILWAPQGNLGLPALSGDVVEDIRTSLGAQVFGPRTSPIEARIEEAYLRFFTPGGKLRSGKDAPTLVRLLGELEAAREVHRAALAQYHDFEQAARRVEDLRARRAQARHEAEALTRALGEARARTESYTTLLGEAEKRKERTKAAEAQHQELARRVDEIRTVQQEIEATRKTLSQLRSDAPLRAREVEGREKATAQAKAALEDVRKGRQAVDRAEERAALARRYREGKRTLAGLDERLQRIATASKTLARRQKERAELVAPDAKALRAIRKALKERDDAQVRLDAALITLEIVPEKAAPLTVVAGEETGTRKLAPGVPIQVKGAPEVVVHLPGVARLRARGPAESVAELRDARDKAMQRLKALTEGFGTADLDTLEALSEKARALDEVIAEAETQLQTLLGGESVGEIESERARLAAVLEEIAGRERIWLDTPPDVEMLEAAAERTKRSFITAVENAETVWETAQAALTAAVGQKADLGARLDETGRQMRSLESRLAELTSDGKQAAERQAQLQKIALAWDAARAALEQIEKQLAPFGGDPRDEVARLEKQLRAADEVATTALEEEKREEGRLEHLSAQGLYSALVQAEEDIERFKREVAAEEVRVAAVRLLHDTIAQCRTEALAAVAAPVEAAATRMLQRIAGGQLGRVELGEAFEPARVVPELVGTTVPVEQISGGEREQVYLATRLALADVLARDGRQLVVLDDVLTASDAGRLARIMAILEESAQRLQVLVLTCHPERYGGLDQARFIDLEAIVRRGSGILGDGA